MKAKITLTIQTIGMYLMHLPLYAMLIIIHIAMDERLQGDLIRGMLIASFVMMLIIAMRFYWVRKYKLFNYKLEVKNA